MIAGETADTEDDADPRTAYMRGIWFDGDDHLVLSGLMLNYHFNIRLWLRPTSADGTLVAILNPTQVSPVDKYLMTISFVASSVGIVHNFGGDIGFSSEFGTVSDGHILILYSTIVYHNCIQ